MRRLRTVWIVKWCGGECRGNPHPTRHAAKEWIDRMYKSAAAAKQPIYDNYTIEAKVIP